MNPVYIVMGVSGCGKTTVGRALAKRLKLPFYDADDYHPSSNVAKMSSGTPLTDADRQPWLDTLAEHIGAWTRADGAVLACSALKARYRDTLSGGAPEAVRYIWLDASAETIRGWMENRAGHYMPPELLDSQIATLEPPEQAVHLCWEILMPPQVETAVDTILQQL